MKKSFFLGLFLGFALFGYTQQNEFTERDGTKLMKLMNTFANPKGPGSQSIIAAFEKNHQVENHFSKDSTIVFRNNSQLEHFYVLRFDHGGVALDTYSETTGTKVQTLSFLSNGDIRSLVTFSDANLPKEKYFEVEASDITSLALAIKNGTKQEKEITTIFEKKYNIVGGLRKNSKGEPFPLRYIRLYNDTMRFEISMGGGRVYITSFRIDKYVPSGFAYSYDIDSSYLCLKSSYIDGLKKGIETEFYPNGKMKRTSIFAPSALGPTKHGFETMYREDGTRFLDGEYQRDKKIGVWTEYSPDGHHQESVIPYCNGVPCNGD